MNTFKDFLRWYNNRENVSTLQAVQNMVDFYHNKAIDILNPGCPLPSLEIICLHKSTKAKFYPFTQSDKAFLEKIREDMVVGPSIVLTRTTAVHERDSIFWFTKWCKSIARIDAIQFIDIPCVKRYLRVSIQDGSYIRIRQT